MECLQQFSKYQTENDKSKETISGYKIDLNQFFKYYKKDLIKLSKNDIEKYINHLLRKGLEIKSINRKLAALSQFINYYNENIATNKKVEVKIKQLKIENQSFINDMLSNSDIKLLINAAERENDIRAVTIFYTLYYTGARVSEILQIKAKDINKDSITVKGKGNKYRDILIPSKLKEQWLKYMNVRSNNTLYLFSGKRGAITRQTVHKSIKEYCLKSKRVKKNLAYAHAFRHLYAQNLAELGVNPVIIAQLLGHSLSVTGIYIQQSKKELIRLINGMSL